MIRFLRVRWKNFLATGNDWIEVDLSAKKTTLVVGPNGVGKSTMLDALSFALFKKPFRTDINLPELVNDQTQRDCVVEVELESRGRAILIRRGLRPNVLEVLVDGALVNDVGKADMQAWIEGSLVGMNHRASGQIVAMGSADHVPFLKLPKGDRRRIIEDLLDVKVLSTMGVALKSRADRHRDRTREVEQRVALVEGQIDVHEHHNSKVADLIREQARQRQSELNAISKTGFALVSEQKDAVATQRELKKSIKDAEEVARRVNDLRQDFNWRTVEARRLEEAVERASEADSCPTCGQALSEAHIKAHVTAARAERDDNAAELLRVFEELQLWGPRHNEIAAVVSTIGEIDQRVANQDRELDRLRAESLRILREKELLEKKLEAPVSAELERLGAELKELLKEKDSLLAEGRVLTAAAQLLKDDGIRGRIVSQYVPVMNQLVNKYLAAMDFFGYFEMDEDFGVKIVARHRSDRSYGALSEGQKVRVDLALLFTWRDVAKMKNSVSTNLLVMDEILDGSLDVYGVDDFIRLINEMTSETNLFVMSHRGDQLMDKFSDTIRFEMTSGFTKVAE